MIDRVCHLIKMKVPELNGGLLFASGITVPTDGAAGYQTGCIFQHTDGTSADALYVNEGSVTSCDFNAVQSDKPVTRTHAIALSDLRCEDAAQTLLPATPDGNGGTLGLGAAAGSPVLGSDSNSGATGTQREYAMFDFVVPADYVVGEDLTVTISAFVSDSRDTASPLDVIAKLIKSGALDSTDIQATAAIDIKAVVAAADQVFTITGDSTGDELAPGSVINVLIDVTTVDTSEAANGHVQINGIAVGVPSYR